MGEKSLQDLFLEIGIAVERFMNDMQTQIDALKNQKSKHKSNISLAEQKSKKKEGKGLTPNQLLRKRLAEVGASNPTNMGSALNAYYKIMNPLGDLDFNAVDWQIKAYLLAPKQRDEAVRIVNYKITHLGLLNQERAKLQAGIMFLTDTRGFKIAKRTFLKEIEKKDGDERFFDIVNEALIDDYQPK